MLLVQEVMLATLAMHLEAATTQLRLPQLEAMPNLAMATKLPLGDIHRAQVSHKLFQHVGVVLTLLEMMSQIRDQSSLG